MVSLHFFILPLAVGCLLTACQTQLPPPPATFDDRFSSADINQDGLVNEEELGDFLAYHLFYQRDTNRDGKLSVEEWWPGADALERAGFDKRDANDNNAVTLEEARRFARKDSATKQTIQLADRDGDGSASWKEINAYLGLL
jgi:hypothetical protein